MQAYNGTDLYNKYIREQASEAFNTGCIGEETYKKILLAYPCKLYTPNYFIRIALALLTIVAVLFSALLLGLIFNTSSSVEFITLFIFLAILCYAALEVLVKRKQYYNAGVDNILMISVITFIISAFVVNDFTNQSLFISGVSFFICLWLCIRFTDAFMGTLAYIALFAFIFLLYSKLGYFAKASAPLVMMSVSALIYVVMKKLLAKERLMVYQFCFKAATLLTLITFYVSGNYFAVKEINNEMFNSGIALNSPIPFGWLFWILTLVIPPAYLFYGVRKKYFLFIRTGLALIAATIFTVRYYYGNFPAETDMLIIGTILITVSYALIKYLHRPKHGFTFAKSSYQHKEILNAEALIIAQTFGKKITTESSVQFGGGTSGGGGATGDY